MKRLVSLLVMGGLITSAAQVQAEAQDTGSAFEPESPWALDYGDDYCRLARSFSNGSESIALALERIQPGPATRMVLVGDAIGIFRRADQIGWRFTPDGSERQSPYSRSQTPDGQQMLIFGGVTVEPFTPPAPGSPPTPPPAYDRAKEQAQAKGKTGFILERGLTAPVSIQTDDLEAPIAALQACADDLASTWGLDPEKLKTQQSPAIPEGGGAGWLPQGTIGFDDFAKFADGSNQVRLLVDAQGQPTSCNVHWPVLDTSTNEKICKTLMDTAAFEPAKDADGNAIPGYFVTSPTFLLPPFRGGRGR